MLVFYLNYSSCEIQRLFPQQPGSSPQSRTDLLRWKGQSRTQEDGGLFRIIENGKYPALHVKLTPPPCHHYHSCFTEGIVTGLSWAQMSSQSSFRWDEYKVRNIVKDFLKKTKNQTNPPVVNRMGNVENVTRCLSLQNSSSTGQRRTDRNKMRQDERRNKLKIYWRQSKMQETRTEWQRGGSGAHTETLVCSDRFNVFVLCYKSFFCFYSSRELNRSVLFYQNIHVLNVKWI